MNRKLVPHHSNWGAFNAVVEDGKVVGAVPFELDPDPSPLIDGIADAVHSPTRIPCPMVRAGWLKDGRTSGQGRGREPFVRVTWERAIDLVAGELARVRREYGPSGIMGGSQGWSSAGHFYEARGQLRRFLAASGGFVDQTSNYSFGTALTFLPHILGSAQAVTGPLTSWSSIALNTRLFVMFGGANPKNTQVAKGGCAWHGTSGAFAALARAGVRVINVSPIRDDGPDAIGPEWIAIRPNTDTAMMLALAHTLLTERRHDEAFLTRYCNGFPRVLPYLTGAADSQPKDTAWAAAITGVPAETIRKLARQMAATRTMLTASWSLQRADHGEQPYWRWCCSRHASARSDCRAADLASVMARAHAWPSRRCSFPARRCRRCPIPRSLPYPPRASRTACCAPASATTTTATARLIWISAWSTGPAAIRSTTIKT